MVVSVAGDATGAGVEEAGATRASRAHACALVAAHTMSVQVNALTRNRTKSLQNNGPQRSHRVLEFVISARVRADGRSGTLHDPQCRQHSSRILAQRQPGVIGALRIFLLRLAYA
jgi:hypothetical protein